MIQVRPVLRKTMRVAWGALEPWTCTPTKSRPGWVSMARTKYQREGRPAFSRKAWDWVRKARRGVRARNSALMPA
jgi:hypothetical protein